MTSRKYINEVSIRISKSPESGCLPALPARLLIIYSYDNSFIFNELATRFNVGIIFSRFILTISKFEKA